MNKSSLKMTDMGILAEIAYSDYGANFIQSHIQNNLPLTSNENGTFTLSSAYTVIDFTSTSTSMQALLLQKTGTNEYVIAFRGTQEKFDIGVDVIIGLSNYNPQFEDAKAFVQAALDRTDCDISVGNLTLTGHSLGGILTQSVGAVMGIQGYAFNPLGTERLLTMWGDYTPTLAEALINVGIYQVLNAFGLESSYAAFAQENILNVSYNDNGSLNGDVLSNLASSLSSDHLGNYLPMFGDNIGLDGHSMGVLNEALRHYNEILSHFTDATIFNDLSTVYALAGEDGFNRVNTVFSDLNITATPNGSLQFAFLNEIIVSAFQNLATDPSHLYALLNLNPFAITGIDYSAHNQNGELDLASYSDKFIEDRALFLYHAIHPNQPSNEAYPIQFIDQATGQMAFSENQTSNLGNARYIFGTEVGETLEGRFQNDHLFGMDGNDRLIGNIGNDYLEGGRGQDQLEGGAGNDIYYYTPGDGADTIIDGENSGAGFNRIIVGGFDLSDVQAQFNYATARGLYLFTDAAHGLVFEWDSFRKTLLIMGSALDSAGGSLSAENSITINNIDDFRQIRERFGIDLPLRFLSTLTTDNRNPFSDPVFVVADGSDTMREAGAQRLNLALNQPLKLGDTITISIDSSNGISSDLLQLITGDQQLSFANGSITLPATEGQTFLSLAILEQGDLSSDASVTFRATVQTTAVDGSAVNTESNLFTLGISDTTFSSTDVVDGTAAGDYLSLQSQSARTLFGQAGNDFITGSGEADLIYAGDGDDVIFGNDGNDIIDAGAGNDIVTALRGEAVVHAGDGNDIVRAGWEFQVNFTSNLSGEINQQTMWQDISAHMPTSPNLGFQNYSIDPTTGDTVFQGNSVLGDGWTYSFRITDLYDHVTYTHPTLYPDGIARADIIDVVSMPQTELSALNAAVLLDGGAGDDYLEGKNADDILLGGSGTDKLLGRGGNDFLDGGTGDDILNGGSGADILYGGDDNDLLDGSQGDDYLNGELGNDQLLGAAGDDTLFGGEGDDVLVGDADNLSSDLHGNDYLNGGVGNDNLSGNGGDDILFGGEGDDLLWGDAGNDFLQGDAGNDQLVGDLGDDLLFGGSGRDLLFGQDGNDYLSGGDDNDQLVGGIGDDNMSGDDGNDYLWGDDGNDTLNGGAGSDYLEGGNGNDLLNGGTESDTLYGGAGDDVLCGGDGNDFLHGGPGSDTLIGGAGQDTYVYQRGDGRLSIIDDGINTLTFGSGIAAGNISLGLGSLLIRTGLEGDEIHIENFAPGDIYAQGAIDRFEFADGTVLSYEQLLEHGFDITGSSGNDLLTGTGAVDRIFAGSGDDTLNGGAGDDLLSGEDGNDSYLFSKSSGLVIIEDRATDTATSVADRVRFSDGITPDELSLVVIGEDLHVSVTGVAGRLIIRNALQSDQANQIEWFDFDAAPSWNLSAIESAIGHINSVPTVTGPVPLGSMLEDGSLLISSADLLASASDIDGDSLSVVNLTADCGSLVDNSDGTWIYQPAANASGFVNFSYAVSDGVDTVPTAATLEITAVNDAPLLAAALVDQTATQGSLFSYQVPVTSFIDPDAGDSLTYSAALNDGSALPSWLGFDAATGTFGGTPNNNDSGSWFIQLVATDQGGLSVSDNFILNIEELPAVNLITGTDGNDTLIGSDGNDLIDGGAGIDLMVGGQGDDVYLVDGYVETQVVAGDSGEEISHSDHNFSARDKDHGKDKDKEKVRGNKKSRDKEREIDNDHDGDHDGDDNDDHNGDHDGDDNDNHDRSQPDTDDGTSSGDTGEQVVTTYVTDIVTEALDGGYDQVYSSITYNLTENVEALLLTGDDNLDGTGNALDNLIVGNAGNNLLSGGLGADTLQGGPGDDSYLFNSGDGQDTILNNDLAGVDRILFGADVDTASIVLLRSDYGLEISYGNADQVTVSDYFSVTDARIDLVQCADGALMTAADIDALIQQMSAYAVQEGISLSSLENVRQNDDLMTMVASSWRAA